MLKITRVFGIENLLLTSGISKGYINPLRLMYIFISFPSVSLSSIPFYILSSSFCFSIISSSIAPSLPQPSHSANSPGGCPSLSRFLSLCLLAPSLPPSLSPGISACGIVYTRSIVASWLAQTSQLLAKEEKNELKSEKI